MQVEETTQSTPLRPTRAGFVRGLPLSMPVEEVIERGREVGIQLQPSDIHAARYYMRQQGGAAPAAGSSGASGASGASGSSAPQQLMLGGTFEVKNGGNKRNGSASASGAPADADADNDFEDDEARSTVSAVAAPKRRKIVTSKAILEARIRENAEKEAAAKEAAAKAASSAALHDRLQARLANATFRQTAKEQRKEERRAEKAEKLAAKQAAKQAAKEAAKEAVKLAQKRSARVSAREERLTEQRQTARTKQELQARQQRQERLEKATIGKALLDVDSVKSRNKRVQSTAVLEGQARLIALRLGTQRVRELLDEIESVARQA